MEQRKRLNAFKEEQKRLEMRLSLLFRLLNYAQPRLSPYEKRFFGDELGSFEERTREFQRLTDQLSARVQSAKTVSTPQHLSLSKRRTREAIQQALPTQYVRLLFAPCLVSHFSLAAPGRLENCSPNCKPLKKDGPTVNLINKLNCWI